MESVLINEIEEVKKLKKRISEFLLGNANSIDSLMREKLDDFTIIKELPQSISIGGKRMLIGNFTIENEHEFFNKWARLIGLMSAEILNWELSAERRKELCEKMNFHLIANGKDMVEFLYRSKRFMKDLAKIIFGLLVKQQAYFQLQTGNRVNVEWKNKHWKFFWKNLDKETLIQIAYLIYFYNFDGVKKNLSLLVDRLNCRQLTEMYIYFWLQNMDGLTGKFLLAQAPSIDSVFNDDPNEWKKPTKKPSEADEVEEDE